MARAMEDPSNRFIKFVSDQLGVPEALDIYFITGKSAADVIAILKSIVNNREGPYGYIESNIFILKIEGQQGISFTLEANPTNDQPGNGTITRNKKALTYERLTEELMKLYPESTDVFVEDIQTVFKDNSKLLGCENTVIPDVYILLLFEIGRRLVDDKKVPKEHRTDKQAYDNLPIIEAITKIVKLFEAKECSFQDVFDPEGKLHCFTGSPSERQSAINRLHSNVNYEDIKAIFYRESDNSSKDAEDNCGQNPNIPSRQITIAGSLENPSKRFTEELQKIPATHWNITGLNAASVISIFKSIVNDRETFKREAIFTFNVQGDEGTISFILEADPTDKQPGNGFIRRRNPKGGEDIQRKYDKELIEILTQGYCSTNKFAQDIRRVFKNNSELFKCGNEIILDVYIHLLFEVGRRLVDDENVPEEHRAEKQVYDSLPISEAITKIVKSFAAKKCKFEDFFDYKGRFHCFTGSPSKRACAIEELESNEKYEYIKALFYGEEDKESFEDAATEG